MSCQCCGKQKSRIGAKDSKLIKGTKLLLCTDCKREDHEPRYFVVIAARSGRNVRDYIVHNRYCGEELAAADVIF